jgi:hypothetical protein
MAELVVVVPTRGRPAAAAALAGAFAATRTADTVLLLAVDESDAYLGTYRAVVDKLAEPWLRLTMNPSASMVEALNLAVAGVLGGVDQPIAVGFCGDDHRFRSSSWDSAYLDALAACPGIAYGDDLVQGEALPTQCAMSTSVVRALGHMAPPVLRHLYLDNYWLTLGRAADCLTYLPEVVVEHVHPVTGKVPWDEGHLRVNDPALYAQDREAFNAYWAEFGDRDTQAVRRAVAQ